MKNTFTESDYGKVSRLPGGSLATGHRASDVGTAQWIVGGLSKPGKMPGPSYALVTDVCHVGNKLRGVKGSVCEGCYADRGRYRLSNVKKAGFRRLYRVRQAVKDERFRSLFVEAMTELLMGHRFMRWHDAGDILSTGHLGLICEIADKTPWCRHWLPTKEYGRCLLFMADGGTIPDNLVVRVSAFMVDESPPDVSLPLLTSTVSRDGNGLGYRCPATLNHTTCDGVPLGKGKGERIHAPCRACWDCSVPNVDYCLHTGKVSSDASASQGEALWAREAGATFAV